MKQFGKVFLAAAVLFGVTAGTAAKAEVPLIQPTINLQLPTITFGSGISPITGAYSNDALNILRAHQVALQQVQAAILYLTAYRQSILAGENQAYNAAFGDFYNPNSQFAGQYDRLVTRFAGFAPNGDPIYKTYYNTAHYDRVLSVFQNIQQALQQAIHYDLGAQLTLAADGTVAPTPIFDSYRYEDAIIGDPSFGNGTGGLASQLVTTTDRGEMKWGHSTSFSQRHLDRLAAGGLLIWDEDNDISTAANPLTPEEELRFFKDKLSAYAILASVSDEDVITPETIFVGGAFLNQEERSASTPDGTPNAFFHPTALDQYQMIIAALAETNGTLVTSSDGTTIDSTVQILAGLLDLYGETSGFFAALDSSSYANFANVFTPMQEGGIGDGSLLPPPGKHATSADNFIPIVPGS